MRPPIAARVLGYAGLIPFVGLALVTAIGGDATLTATAAQGALIYGGVILSFMGGCRWGFAAAGLGAGPSYAALGLSVAPALLGWAALWLVAMIGATWTAALLVVGFALLYLDDARTQTAGGAPEWWTALRLPLTLGASLSLIVIGLAA